MGVLTATSARFRDGGGQRVGEKLKAAMTMGAAGGSALKGPGSKGFARMRPRKHIKASQNGGRSTSDRKCEAARRNIRTATKVRMEKRAQAQQTEQAAKALAEWKAKMAQTELEEEAQVERDKKAAQAAKRAEPAKARARARARAKRAEELKYQPELGFE